MEALDGRSFTWLSNSSGVADTTIGSMVYGAVPRADNALKIAQSLGITVEFLMTGEQPRGAPVGKVAEPPAGWQPSQARVRSVGERMREAELAVEEASQETAIIPDEGLRQALMALQVRYGIEAEDLALLLGATHRAQVRRG